MSGDLIVLHVDRGPAQRRVELLDRYSHSATDGAGQILPIGKAKVPVHMYYDAKYPKI
jgi:hypothetical protein